MNRIGFSVGAETSVVGPISCGSVISVSIGGGCWIGKDISLDGNGSVIIGDNVDIAPHCVLCTGGHLIGNAERRAGEGITSKIIIEDGCWIGTNVTILNNTRIGAGSIIAAGSVVVNDVPGNSLVAGCPAVIKRKLN